MANKQQCRHSKVRREYIEDSVGVLEKQYCVDCGEFIQSYYFEGKKEKDLADRKSPWRHHL